MMDCGTTEEKGKITHQKRCRHDGKEMTSCKECGGKGICEREKYKQSCKECGGVSLPL